MDTNTTGHSSGEALVNDSLRLQLGGFADFASSPLAAAALAACASLCVRLRHLLVETHSPCYSLPLPCCPRRYDAASNAWMSVPLPPNLPTSRAFLTASVVQPF